MADKNGISKPMQDVTGEGYVSTADDVGLIDSERAMTDRELPSSPDSTHRTEISPLQMEGSDDLKAKKKVQEGLKIIIISSVTFALSVTLALILTVIFGPPAVPPHGAVACDSQICSDLALGILKQGGSGVDAAIAGLLCLGVVNPHRSGIGGGFMMVIREHAKNTSTVINAREKAPGGATEDRYKNEDDLRVGELSVAVPGSLRGMQLAHDQYGKLSWKDIVTPVADLARHGVPVSKQLADAIKLTIDPRSPLDGALVDLFYREGRPVEEGDVIMMSRMAELLDSLATDGVDVFYTGRFGEEIVNATSGAITAEDLASYKADQMHTLKKSFANRTFETVPAPGGGPLLLFVLSVLQQYTLSESNQTDYLYYHRLIEALKFMAGERYRFGDPDFVNTVDNDTEVITSPRYAEKIRNLISDDRVHPTDYYMKHGGVKPETGMIGTAHISVIDPDEILVAVSSTINSYFGSHLVTTSGIILNNQMYDFDLSDVKTNNNIEPGKRPLSSLTPTVVHEYKKPCSARIAVGGINGTRIIPGVIEVLLNNIVFGEDVKTSIGSKRICNPLIPDQVEYEDGFSEDILGELKTLGHKNFILSTDGIDFVHAIAKINETVMAAADRREDKSGSSIF